MCAQWLAVAALTCRQWILRNLADGFCRFLLLTAVKTLEILFVLLPETVLATSFDFNALKIERRKVDAVSLADFFKGNSRLLFAVEVFQSFGSEMQKVSVF